VGSYAIIVGRAWNTNYAVTFVNGTLTVTEFRAYLPFVSK
jgi:hypothetical protein